MNSRATCLFFPFSAIRVARNPTAVPANRRAAAADLPAELGGDGWLMFADHFGPDFHGYVPFANADVATDAWRCVPAAETDIPPNTKHGAVLPLRVSEYERQFPS